MTAEEVEKEFPVKAAPGITVKWRSRCRNLNQTKVKIPTWELGHATGLKSLHYIYIILNKVLKLFVGV